MKNPHGLGALGRRLAAALLPSRSAALTHQPTRAADPGGPGDQDQVVRPAERRGSVPDQIDVLDIVSAVVARTEVKPTQKSVVPLVDGNGMIVPGWLTILRYWGEVSPDHDPGPLAQAIHDAITAADPDVRVEVWTQFFHPALDCIYPDDAGTSEADWSRRYRQLRRR